ncbi:hypothetical protein Gpo141_00012469, partial [Globisporangium polare]
MTDEGQRRWFAPSAVGTGASSSAQDNVSAPPRSASSSPAHAASTAAAKPTFDCNICLDTVASPVVTLCGHLYCWPCLYQWMESRSECPVCKAGISVENVIPVYGRGAESADPRTQEMSENGVPSRPRGQRPVAEQLRQRRPRQFGVFNNNQNGAAFSMSPTIGFFPALFGIPLLPPGAGTHRPDGTPLTPMEVRQQMQQAFLSRLLL